jgi:hypothetical protein
VSEERRTLSELAREHTADALTTLIQVATTAGTSESARIAAAVAILDRAYGRPAQTISGPLNGGLMIVYRDPEDGRL